MNLPSSPDRLIPKNLLGIEKILKNVCNH